MATLGEAFIEVKADLTPFTRRLQKELLTVAKSFEKVLDSEVSTSIKKTSDKAGADSGERIRKGINQSFEKKGAFVSITSALGSALDDGISALPAEVKAAIVVGVLAATPLIGGYLTGAVVGGVGVGVAGLGIALASQFTVVQDRFNEFTDNVRVDLVEAARPFAPAVINALDIIENRIEQLEPTLEGIFGKGAAFLQPLALGVADALEGVLKGLDDSLGDTQGFVEELGRGLKTVGDAIGEAFRILASTGEDGQEALRDLLFLVGYAIVNFAELLAALTKVYGVIRNIAEVMPGLNIAIGAFVQASNDAAGATTSFAYTNVEYINTTGGAIAATKEQEKALKDQAKAAQDSANALFGLIDAQIDFERVIDEFQESQTGKSSFNIGIEEGRDNVELLIRGIKAAQKALEEKSLTENLTAQQATIFYQQEIDRLRASIQARGENLAIVNDIIARTEYLGSIKVVGESWDQLRAQIVEVQKAIAKAVAQAERLRTLSNRGGGGYLPNGGGFQEFAEGGIVRSPTTAIIGEAGPEVVVPLTNPARAAQLMSQSGLAGMLGGSGGSSVQVFIGDEQLETRMIRVVESNNRTQSRALQYGMR